MKRKIFIGLLVLLEMVVASSMSADEIKKNEVIIIDKNELGKYLYHNKKKTKLTHNAQNNRTMTQSSIKTKIFHKPNTKKSSTEMMLLSSIKEKNLMESLVLYKRFMIQNGKSKIAEKMILKKSKDLKNLDFEFFKKDFLRCDAKKLSTIIKELSNEYR